MQPFEDEDVPLFTVGQVAEMLSLKQAFLRRVDQLQVVSPQRSNGGQRRYTRIEIRIIQQVASMADEGMTMSAISGPVFGRRVRGSATRRTRSGARAGKRCPRAAWSRASAHRLL